MSSDTCKPTSHTTVNTYMKTTLHETFFLLLQCTLVYTHHCPNTGALAAVGSIAGGVGKSNTLPDLFHCRSINFPFDLKQIEWNYRFFLLAWHYSKRRLRFISFNSFKKMRISPKNRNLFIWLRPWSSCYSREIHWLRVIWRFYLVRLTQLHMQIKKSHFA